MKSDRGENVLLAGATGTIGRAVAHKLVSEGYTLTCLLREESDASKLPPEASIVRGTVAGAESLRNEVFSEHSFDAVISCIASRSGVARDAWAVDHKANLTLLRAAEYQGVAQFILLSAICVQKPRLAFQHAKLAFEAELRKSTLDWLIIRPTAFFKSLSGQIARVQAGKPFLVFGDGKSTACKPISDEDLATFIVQALSDETMQNSVLPVGGPGPAITPVDQAGALSDLLGKTVPVRHVPPSLLLIISKAIGAFSFFSEKVAEKAELARIGHYYATESMLVWDAAAERYDADATPEFGATHLFDHYRNVINGFETPTDLGTHAMFSKE